MDVLVGGLFGMRGEGSSKSGIREIFRREISLSGRKEKKVTAENIQLSHCGILYAEYGLDHLECPEESLGCRSLKQEQDWWINGAWAVSTPSH